MAINDYQRHSFLGGEVSPALYERADMDKFGRWFSVAENIRFFETGGFRNRPGFVKVANTRNNIAGQNIKLLSFSFNDEESFLVELGPGYARFFKDGQIIMNGAEPYEISTPFLSFGENDIKYAQAGDTVFITHPNYGIYELIRNNKEGTSWTMRKFKADFVPMKEINENKDNTVSLALAQTQPGVVTLTLKDDAQTQYFVNPTLTVHGDSSLDFALTGRVSHQDFANAFNTAFSESGVQINAVGDAKLSVVFEDVEHMTATSLELNYLFEREQTISNSIENEYGRWDLGTDPELTVAIPVEPNASYIKEVTTSLFGKAIQLPSPVSDASLDETVSTSIKTSVSDSIDAIVNQKGYLSKRLDSIIVVAHIPSSFDGKNVVNIKSKSISVIYVKNISDTVLVAVPSVENASKYVLTFNGDDSENFLKTEKIVEGDTVLLLNSVDSQSWSTKLDSPGSTWTSGPSNGKWRTYSLGNWKGNVMIEYSTDNKQTWTKYFKWASEDKDNYPYNVSTSGTINSDDSVYFRVTVNVTDGNIKIFFGTDDYVTNSYYKIDYVSPDKVYAFASPLKNDIGEVTANYKWRTPAFSSYEGFPQSLGFYQNRLFFAKDYILYGSKTNDFWDFYEPTSLQADDPITMSLLSTKANIIRNIVTQRSFFVFTSGGEFGIGSDGALTQNDKYLKAFSANGSSKCLPVLISDVVLFVDKSENSVRALKYSLESDGYEAPDITLMLRELLKEEQFVTSDIIFEEKEAIFLSSSGTIWVLKYITDQNILAWCHWKHAKGNISNLCVVPNGAKHDVYICVEKDGEKWIEKMQRDIYLDTVETFDATEDEKVTVNGFQGETKIVLQNNKKYKMIVDGNRQIECPPDTTASFLVGDTYVSTATLLSPTIQLTQESSSNYEKKTIFKVFFYYLNSYGFKVGVSDGEKMKIEWQPVESTIDEENELTSGKKSVLIPSSFDGSERLTFVQEEPYPMEIHDVLSKTDFGGK